MNQLSFFVAAHPANRSASPDCAEAWPTSAETWPLSFYAWLTDSAPAGWFGRTSPASVHPAEDGTLAPSSGGWANSGMGGPIGALMLSTPVWHSDASVCSLSDILETGDLPQRYYLSPRACAGILRRAAKRGKELPPQLREALQAVEGFDASEDGTGRGVPLVCGTLTSNGDAHSGFKDEHGPVAFGWQNSASQGDSTSVLTFPTLDKSKTPAIAFDLAQITSAANRTRAELGLPASAMAKGSQKHVSLMAAVRRLTPRECERLQGFPDDFTLVPYRRGMAADGPRYRALGNSMAVPVLRWIGRRISDVDSALMKNC